MPDPFLTGDPPYADQYPELFPVHLTDSVQTGGTWFYTWTEQTFNAATGVYADALSPRTGTKAAGPDWMVEVNNQGITTPAYAWARLRGVVAGQTWYEFEAGVTAGAGGGTVTSVGLTVPVEFSVAGSPVTTAGTLAVTKVNEAANTVWAGPTSGAPAVPTFRALVSADLPGGGSGTVTSVDHADQYADGTVFSPVVDSGGPVVASGTLLSRWKNQGPYTVLAAPTNGSVGKVDFHDTNDVVFPVLGGGTNITITNSGGVITFNVKPPGGIVNGATGYGDFNWWGDNSRYYYAGRVTPFSPGSTIPVAADTIIALPLILPRGFSTNLCGVRLTGNGSAGAKIRMAIYDNNSAANLLPSTLLSDSGDLAADAGATTNLTWNPGFSGQPPGLYWFCYMTNSVSLKPTVRSCASTQSVFPILGFDTSLTSTGVGWFVANSYGAYPGAFPGGAAVMDTTGTQGWNNGSWSVPILFTQFTA